MRRITSLILITLLVLSGLGLTVLFDFTTQDVAGKTEITSNISGTVIWSPASDPYMISASVSILSGATLTINQGTEVQFNGSYTITIGNGAQLIVQGSKGQEVNFKVATGAPTMFNIINSGSADFDWCTFEDAVTAIDLDNNDWGVNIANCSFSTCGDFFDLTQSKLNVTSSKFDGKQFDETPLITENNMANNITLDSSSELYIEYFVNVVTVNGTNGPIKDVTVSIQESPMYNNAQGRTNSNGEFSASPITAAKITGTSPVADFSYINTITVEDKWKGTSRAVTGISENFTVITNASTEIKDSDLHINLVYMFKYPPIIQTTSLSGVKVYEDIPKTASFVVYDNDDLNSTYNNLTFNITDQHGNGIYGSNTMNEWITWDSSTNMLQFYRTIESPDSPPAPNDFDAQIAEEINIKIIDDDGLMDSVGPFTIEWHNVPDKPEITGLPSAQDITEVTEDEPTYLSIVVSDNDNVTSDIHVYSNSKYLSYDIDAGFPNNQSLKLLYPNEFGEDNKQQLVWVNATDGCWNEVSNGYNEVSYSFLVKFSQTPDPPEIVGTIPDKYGDETNWQSDMALGQYASDPDPDDTSTDLKWFVTGLDKKVYGKKLFTVSNENATADAPLSFNLNPDIDLGGARDIPLTIEDKITLWLMDKDGNMTSQDVSLFINATNQPPSLHKVDIAERKVTVDPESGLTSDTFTFQVEYKDQDGEFGDAPEFVKVYIDGNEYDMVEVNPNDKDYTDGKKYKYEISMLGAGSHEHHFVCSDSNLTTRLPLIDAEPNEFPGPEIEAKLNILKKSDPDENFIVRIAHMDFSPFAEVLNVTQPAKEIEPGVSAKNKTKDDFGKFFQVETSRTTNGPSSFTAVIWVEITVKFGLDFSNYDVTWLRKSDLQLGYYLPVKNEWSILSISTMDTKNNLLKCNLTSQTGQTVLLKEFINASNKPIFTVIGILDADGDGVFNSKDAFPFDPAASEDSDLDGSPDRWNPGKSAKDSTSGLHLDDFKSDPAASIDNDNDNCPDEWNPGKSQADSTSDPKLTLDQFLDDKRACLDTDGDNMPDSVRPGPGTPLVEDTDDDNDGMPDWWEEEWLQYALDHNLSQKFNPKNASDANKDFDGDGIKNIDEYKEGKNPYEKDADEGLGQIGGIPMLYIIIIIIVIIVVIIIGLVIRNRGKKEPEDLPRGMGAPPPEPESIEGEFPPDSRVEAPVQPPEGEIPPMIPPAEQDAMAAIAEEEGEPEPVLGESVSEVPAESYTEEEPTIPAQEVPEQEQEVAGEPPMVEEAPMVSSAEGTAVAADFTCPNCNTGLNRDMTQCPGCGAPLAFD